MATDPRNTPPTVPGPAGPPPEPGRRRGRRGLYAVIGFFVAMLVATVLLMIFYDADDEEGPMEVEPVVHIRAA